MATQQRREDHHEQPPELTKADRLRRADEALERAEEHHKRVLEALERLRQLARR